jgi:hypothetical protein
LESRVGVVEEGEELRLRVVFCMLGASLHAELGGAAWLTLLCESCSYPSRSGWEDGLSKKT